jgi:RNA-binding protein Musashi
MVMASFNCVVYQVLGIPWDIDTEGLRQYMLRFGELDDVIVMKVS